MGGGRLPYAVLCKCLLLPQCRNILEVSSMVRELVAYGIVVAYIVLCKQWGLGHLILPLFCKPIVGFLTGKAYIYQQLFDNWAGLSQ
jgi:hypothetical protein